MKLEKQLKDLSKRIEKFDKKSQYWLDRWIELNKKGKTLSKKLIK